MHSENEVLFYFYKENGDRKIVASVLKGDVMSTDNQRMVSHLAHNWNVNKIYMLVDGTEFLYYEK